MDCETEHGMEFRMSVLTILVHISLTFDLILPNFMHWLWTDVFLVLVLQFGETFMVTPLLHSYSDVCGS